MGRVKRVLISVYDKKGIIEFSRSLHNLGIEIISTGGTAKALKEESIPVINISDVTGYPEMLDGRVKTLHPKIHGGILAQREKEEHLKQLEQHKIEPIEMVIVNLYPFEETIARPDVTLEDAIEQIDIGGVALIRSAGKNFSDVAVVVNPNKYELIIEELKNNNCELTKETRMRLSVEAFKYTSLYDSAIHNYLLQLTKPVATDFPNELNLTYTKVMDLRYGENPHQKAAFYRDPFSKGLVSGEPRTVLAKQLHGKELSFNNILDLDGALGAIKEFFVPASVIVKHTNPCGIACGNNIFEAYKKALATDPLSAFGGIVALNDTVNEELAHELGKLFIEVLIAPEYTNSAFNILKEKKNIRIMALPELKIWKEKGSVDWRLEKDTKKVVGGLLVQDRDITDEPEYKVVTEKKPTDSEFSALKFAWKVVKHVKSNAIVMARNNETVAIGAGQMSRVDSVRIAVSKAQKELKGSVMASDAFFPFKDNVEEAAKIGISAIIQPGGSVRDEEVIACANQHGIAMVFTGVRHFKH
jgi:phosphoribosylaminoimidazolecarboxamide formyltransferase/IMP cyclohydrolase